MDFSFSAGRAFFNTAQYESGVEDDTWLSKFEAAADVCRAPSRWLAGELWSGGKTYEVTRRFHPVDFEAEEVDQNDSEGFQKVMRIVMGLIFSLPGQIAAIPLMAIAYCSEEIRLKHKVTVVELSDEEKKKLADLISEREKLTAERQGCEPVSCILLTICYLLCHLACKEN